MPGKSTHLNSEQILKKFKAGDGQGEELVIGLGLL